MPRYSYKCEECGLREDAVRHVDDRDQPLICGCFAMMRRDFAAEVPSKMVNSRAGYFCASTRSDFEGDIEDQRAFAKNCEAMAGVKKPRDPKQMFERIYDAADRELSQAPLTLPQAQREAVVEQAAQAVAASVTG